MKTTHRGLVTGALLLSNVMAGMDGTIVNTAMPAITSDLHALQYMGWIIATFLFGMSVATPLWSKFGEHQGNRRAFIMSTTLFALGALFQAIAPNIVWFIIARTAMGVGAGGMNTIPFIVFARIYPDLKQRSVVVGFASACFGTASIIGPLLGGWIVDILSWHWVFYVNLPIAAIAISIISLVYHEPRPQAAGKKVDYPGAALMISGLILILIAVQLIGSASLIVIISLLLVGCIMIAGLMRIDSKAPDPIIPSRLFINRELVMDLTLFVIIWGSFVAFLTYIPMWAQGILGLSAFLGGVTQIPGAITNFLGSELIPYVQDKINKYTIVLIGCISILIAFAGILVVGQKASFILLLVLGMFEGFGVGGIFNVLQVAVQQDCEIRDVPIATSLAYLLRILSQTMMSAIYGVILNQQLMVGVRSHNDISLNMLNELSNAKTAGRLPQSLLPTMRHILYLGYRDIMFTGLLLIVLSIVVVTTIIIKRRSHAVRKI